jgi:hypothetical protein
MPSPNPGYSLCHFLPPFSVFVYFFFLVFPLVSGTIPLTGKASSFAFDYPDGRESQEVQAPRIKALKCPWLFPSPETLTQVQSASASNTDQASTAGSGTSAAIQG